MTLRATGPGEVYIKNMGASEVGVPFAVLARDSADVRPPGEYVWYVLVYNFDNSFENDGHRLKQEHIDDLRDHVVPLLQSSRDLVVHMSGHASRRGDQRHPDRNQTLSEQRVAEVRKYFWQEGVDETRFRQATFQGFGASRSQGGTIDEKSHRSVAIIIAPPNVPVTHITLPMPEQHDDRDQLHLRRQVVSHNFAMRIELMGRLNVGPEVEVAAIDFTLWDTDNMLTARYRYRGPGVNVAALPLIPVPGSLSFVGPWNCFNTPGPIRVQDFAGGALFFRSSFGPAVGFGFKMLGSPFGSAIAAANRNQPLTIDPFEMGEGIGGTNAVSGQLNAGWLSFDNFWGVKPLMAVSDMLTPSGLAHPSCDARAGLMRGFGGRVIR